MEKSYLYLKLWLPVLIWCSLIFYLSGIPDLSSGLDKTIDLVLRKGAHLVEYAILAFLLWRAIKLSFSMNIVWAYSLSIILSVLYAVSDEIHQSFIPGRGPGVIDVIIDSIGAAIALRIIMKKNHNHSKNC